MNVVVRLGKFTKYLPEAEVTKKYLKRVICELCDETFPGTITWINPIIMYGGNHQHRYPMRPKVFRKRRKN